jgi:hypothetical protein
MEFNGSRQLGSHLVLVNGNRKTVIPDIIYSIFMESRKSMVVFPVSKSDTSTMIW